MDKIQGRASVRLDRLGREFTDTWFDETDQETMAIRDKIIRLCADYRRDPLERVEEAYEILETTDNDDIISVASEAGWL